MAVPITNMKISDITSALSISNTNVSATDLFFSPNIIGSGLDPTYCSGANGYERLANLRDVANVGGTRELRIGKFRNYNPPTIFYRSGLLYNYRTVRAYGSIGDPTPVGKSYLSDTINIPNGWRIMNLNDWVNIITYINPFWGLSSNQMGQYLKHSYDSTDSYFGWIILEGLAYTTFNQLASGNCGLVTTGDVFSPYRLDYLGKNEASHGWCLTDIRSSQPYIIRLNDTNQQADFLNTSSFTFEKNHFANIRLIQADHSGGYNSVDPKYLEDCDGNIYPTVKIGNYVMTAENIRTKKTYDGVALSDYTSFVGVYPNIIDYPDTLYDSGYIDFTDNDIP